MKQNIFNVLLACGAVAALSACSENSWNKDYLDGFEVPPVNSEVKATEYTMTADDYKALADLISAKDAAAETGDEKTLANVGENGYFMGNITAQKYVPMFLSSSSFPYFVADDGSTVLLTYKQSVGLPEICNEIYKASVYTLTNDDYKSVWGETNYALAFSPSCPAASYLPMILTKQYPGAESGQYALVNFNVSDKDPEFNPVQITPVKDVTPNSASYTLDGYVTAICKQGYILSDNTGSVLIYYGSSFDASKYLIGMRMQVSGKGSKYNGGLQISPSDEIEIAAVTYNYPSPETLTAASFDAYALQYAEANNNSTGIAAKYVKADVTFTSVGNYVNFKFDGATYTGSAYQATDPLKALIENNKSYTIEGYVMSANTDRTTKAPTYLNFIITSVNGKAVYGNAPEKPFEAAPVDVEKFADNALYKFDGTKWVASTEAYLISPMQIKEMGYSGSLSKTNAARVLPIFMKQTFPYAAEGDAKYIAYQSGAKYANCDQYVYNGSEWILNNGVEVKTGQWARIKGDWIFNPDVTISIPAVRNSEIGTQIYKPIVDWVKANKGTGYIDSYGNSEFYSGASYYYCNVNVSVKTAMGYSPWANTPENEIQNQMKHNFLYETLPYSLKENYPNANLIDGYTDPIIYEVSYVTYDNGKPENQNTNDTVRYEVTGPGQFKLIYSTWLGGKVSE